MSTLKVDTIQSSTGASPVTINDTLNVAGNTTVTGTLSATGVVTASAGAVGAPAITFGDATTGIYRSAANRVGLAISGGLRAQCLSTGFIAYGALDVVGDAASGQIASMLGSTGYGLKFVTSAVSPFTSYITVGGGEQLGLAVAGTSYLTVSATGAAVTGTLSASGITSVTDATDATSTTSASLKTAGGLGVAKAVYTGAVGNTAAITIGATQGNYQGTLTFAQNNTNYNWQINTSGITGGYMSFVPSTAAGGTTFTTSVLDLSATAVRSNQNIVMASGKGIDFSATANGSGTTTSEVLSDYEEGTWTPAIYGTSTAGAGTYSQQVGKYTKVGRKVTVIAELTWSAHTGTGNMRISGLPFTAGTSNSAAAIGLNDNMTLTAGYLASAYVLANETNIGLVQLPTGGGVAAGIPIDTSSGPLIVTATYFV